MVYLIIAILLVLIIIMHKLDLIFKELCLLNDPCGWISKIYRQNKAQGKEVSPFNKKDESEYFFE